MDALTLFIDHPLFTEIAQEVSARQDPSLNKELLSLARHMGLAQGSGNFARLTERISTLLLDLQYFHNLPRLAGNYDPVTTMEARMKILDEFFYNPFYAGAIVSLCYLLPLTKAQVDEIRMASFMKEILVMDETNTDPGIDFSPFFGNYGASIHPDIDPNPKMANIVHTAINDWIEECCRKEFHSPTMSRKCLPSFTRRELNQYIDLMVENPSEATPASLERLYVKEGIYLDGPCEISQRWYTNGLVPRTYIVAGATAYNDTKYTKWMWNSLVDKLACVNRRNRTNPRRIYIEKETALFYDLTSFTSKMQAQRHFLEHLAQYCQGNSMTIMDSVFGPREVDMGDLIRQYNTMNSLPEYRRDEFFDWANGVHGGAGFLGVFGNIATCTFLHGAVLLQLADAEYECGCAGDDAVICCNDTGRVYACISVIGVLAIEKTFDLRDPDVVYLKRRTWMDPTTFCLRQRNYVQLPSFLPFVDFHTDWRFDRERSMSRAELFNIAASSLMATFRSAANSTVDDITLGLVRDLLARYYSRCSFPVEGTVPQFHAVKNEYTMRFVPALDGLGSRGYIEHTITTLYDGEVWIADRDKRDVVGISREKGTVFRSTGGQYLTFLKRLGYIREVKKVIDRYTGEQGLLKILQEFSSRPDPAWFIYVVTEKVPAVWGDHMEVEGILDDPYVDGFDEFGEIWDEQEVVGEMTYVQPL